MASAAEQLDASLNFGVLAKATELKKRIWFTLGALIVYRLGTYIPVPGVDAAVMGEILAQHGGGILGMFDMFTGGALGRMTVFALNIMPYICACIIMQLMTAAFPPGGAEEGRRGGAQEAQPVHPLPDGGDRHGRRPTASRWGWRACAGSSAPRCSIPGWFFRFSCVITLVGGTMFLMWLGEQITARGVGNGISLIIFAGIVANLPSALVGTLELGRTGALSTFFIIVFLLVALAVIAFVVFIERAQRRIPVQYPKRQVGNRMFGGESHAPAAEAEHRGRDPADLRLLAAAAAGDHRGLLDRPDAGILAAADHRRAGAWPAAVHGRSTGA